MTKNATAQPNYSKSESSSFLMENSQRKPLEPKSQGKSNKKTQETAGKIVFLNHVNGSS